MHLKSSSVLFLIVMVACLICCSPYRNNPVNNSFHDITAHYNAYYIARERIKEIEQSIFDSYDWNYNKILPVYPQFDSTRAASLSEEIEDCVIKSSIAIQRHPESKWEDDSYVLVGIARYYSLEFPDAVETFKYVNTHSENEHTRHEALSWLIRTFTDAEEIRNAEAVVDYLEKEHLANKSKGLFYLNQAYLYQKEEEYLKMVDALVAAEPYLSGNNKARINFIIGQTFQLLGRDVEAFKHYRKTLRSRPIYELEFYSKLYMGQVTELAEINDLKKVRKYFKELLKDPKNLEYQDKIYYEMAGFELKNGNLDEAIATYKLSVRTSQNNQRQKGKSYLSLGKIYYDSIKNYRLAKAYYDSTVSTLPKDEDNYAEILSRKEILDDFVVHALKIQNNDSLLELSKLPQDSLLRMAESIITEKRALEKKRKEKEKKAAINRARNIQSNSSSDLIAIGSGSDTWYFDDAGIVGRGSNTFLKKWGDRPLEDNWRRSKKRPDISGNASAQAPTEIVSGNRSEATGEEPSLSVEEEASLMIADIPVSEDQKQQLLSEIEEALFELGKIYNFRLEEDENAITTFTSLLGRFSSSIYEEEVLYQLFLLEKNRDQDSSEEYGRKLKAKYPESIYAKLVDNPNYREESFAVTTLLQKEYKTLYARVKNGQYNEVIQSVDELLTKYPESEFTDNVALLRALSVGGLEEEYKYQYELNEFLKKYPESELKEYAEQLLKASEDFQKKRYNSGKARFIEYFDQPHTLVVVYELGSELQKELPGLVESFLETGAYQNLNEGNLVLSDKESVLIINQLSDKESALELFKTFQKNVGLKTKFRGQKFKEFVISKDNFEILYETKDVESYLTFFNKFYR
ncbi:MAG: hypothetical protein AAF789_00690 [Bacteroidota bacterium]